MMNRVVMTGLFVLMFLGLAAIGFSFFNQLACEGQPINNNVAPTSEQQIFGERIIGQSFIAPREGLDRIDILFQTYQRQNTADITLRLLELPDETGNPFETGTERFKTTFSAATLRDQSWRSFTFAPIADSAGKHYLITLQSPEAVSGHAATVGGIERDVYAPGSAYLGAVPVQADMTFRTCYQMTAFEKLQVLSEQLTRNRPSVWGQAAFHWLSLGLYGVLLIGFFWKLTQLER